MKTEKQLKIIIGKALGRWKAANPVLKPVSARAMVLADGTLLVDTSASNGDNVPWAIKPMFTIQAVLKKHGLQPKGNKHHCNGNVSQLFEPAKN